MVLSEAGGAQDAFHAVRSRSPRFSQAFRHERTVPFFLWFLLALSGGTSFPGPSLLRTGSIRVLLERNPPKASPRPGWRLRLWGERAIPLLIKKGTLMPSKYTQPASREEERRCRL